MPTRLNNLKLSLASIVDLIRHSTDKKLAEQLRKFIILYSDKSLEIDNNNSIYIKEELNNNTRSYLTFYKDNIDAFIKHKGI